MGIDENGVAGDPVETEAIDQAEIDQEGADAIAEVMSADVDGEGDAIADTAETDDSENKPETPEPELSQDDIDALIRSAIQPTQAAEQTRATDTPKPTKAAKAAEAKKKLGELKDRIKDLDGEAISEGLESIAALFEDEAPSEQPKGAASQGPTEAQQKVIRAQLHSQIEGILPSAYATPAAKDQLIEVAELVAFGARKQGKQVSDAAAIMAAHRVLERAKEDGRKSSQRMRHAGTKQPASQTGRTPQSRKDAAEPTRRKLSPDEEGILAVRQAMRTPAKK